MFSRNINKRIKVLFLLMTFMFVVIVIRVLYIEVFDYEKLKKFIEENKDRTDIDDGVENCL